MSYGYIEAEVGNKWLKKERLLPISSLESIINSTQKLCINQLNDIFINVYRIDVLAYSFIRPLGINSGLLGVKIRELNGKTTCRNNLSFVINVNSNLQTIGLNQVCAAQDLINVYTMLSEDSYIDLQSLTFEYYDAITLLPVDIQGTVSFLLRIREAKKNQYLNQ